MTAINEMLQQPFGQAIGWALLQFVWQGTLIALLTAALLAALRRSGPDVRYVVSTIALALMLTMPVVTVVQTLSSAPLRCGKGRARRSRRRWRRASTRPPRRPLSPAPPVLQRQRPHLPSRRAGRSTSGCRCSFLRLARGRRAVDAAAVQRLDVGAADEIARRPPRAGGPAAAARRLMRRCTSAARSGSWSRRASPCRPSSAG